MKINYLYRSISTRDGTFGHLVVPHANWSCYTLEPPWEDNKVNISCIPSGKRRVGWMKSNKLGRMTYRVLDVRDRTGILFHPLNYVQETDGCIGLGMSVGAVNGKKYLVDSVDAISKFEEIMGGESFLLDIYWRG